MALAHPGDERRENEDLRQWEAARRLAELRLERAVYRILFVTVAILLCMYAMLLADLHKSCMNVRKPNLSSLLVWLLVEVSFPAQPASAS